jgi:hypothetical protein
MRRAWATARAAAVLTLSVAGTAAALSGGRSEPVPPRSAEHGGLTFAAGRGALELDSSHPGTAIFGGSSLAPGGSVSGDLSLTAASAFPADVTLSLSDLVEDLGPSGAHLSSVLRLKVVEEPSAGGARVEYDGLLRDLGSRALQTYAAGETRTYRFTATLPDTTAASAVQGTSATAAFLWSAQEAVGPTPPDSGTPGAPQTPDATAAPEAPATPGATTTTPGRSPAPPSTTTPARKPPILEVRLILPIAQRAHLRGDTVLGWAVCSRPCRLVFSGRGFAARSGASGRRAGPAIPLRAVPAARGLPDRRTRLVLRLTPAARRVLKGKGTLRVTVAVTATDAGGRRARAENTTRVTR